MNEIQKMLLIPHVRCELNAAYSKKPRTLNLGYRIDLREGYWLSTRFAPDCANVMVVEINVSQTQKKIHRTFYITCTRSISFIAKRIIIILGQYI